MGSPFRADTQLRKSVVQPDVPPKAASLTLWFVKSLLTVVPAGKRTRSSPSLSAFTVTSHKSSLNTLSSLEQALTLSSSMLVLKRTGGSKVTINGKS